MWSFAFGCVLGVLELGGGKVRGETKIRNDAPLSMQMGIGTASNFPAKFYGPFLR